jgi:phosphohistidine phosphatase
MSMQPQIMLPGYRLAAVARSLWLLRHADAEPQGMREDFDRRLTATGERQARASGRALARLGVQFDAVFTSPRVRSRDTALIACAELGIAPLVHEPLSGGFGREDLAELEAVAGGDAQLLVGHEPDLSQLIGALTGARVELKKSGLALIRGGVLLTLLRPREIELVAGL